MKIEPGLAARISECIKRYPDRPNHRIAKSFKAVSSATVEYLRGQIGDIPKAESAESEHVAVSGISLTNKRVLSRKPAESAAKFIKKLTRGKAFYPRDLASGWGMSEETIRRHARELGCMKCVEVAEDEWEWMIMHPETAANYKN